MTKGQTFPGEGATARDVRTGALVRQVTSHPSIHHHLYFYIASWADDMRRLFFVSHRSGAPNLFAAEADTGRLVQLTDRADTNEWSYQSSRDGRWVYFTTAAAQVWRLEVATLREELVVAFPEYAGEVHAVTCSLSGDGRHLAVTLRGARCDRIAIAGTDTGRWAVILERDAVWHTQFCPDDADRLLYAGPPTSRLWTIRRDGAANRPLYAQQPHEWITHETWLGRDEVICVRWPEALLAIAVDTGQVRTLARFNAWHPSANRAGTLVVCDTNHPDIGLQVVDARSGQRRPLCYPGATNAGAHWAGPFPYAAKPYPQVVAPQWTHPHPSFSPDGRRVVFTSDRSGWSQVYEVEAHAAAAVPEERRGASCAPREV